MITPPQEADELRQILEEKNKAIDVNDVLALFAIGGLFTYSSRSRFGKQSMTASLNMFRRQS